MSQIHAMSDDQVNAELRKMTAFIRQEALEKAREIQLKADEEFSIEKAQLVRSSTSQIDSEYEKKFKQAGMSQQITKSTLSNKTRLRLLSARQDLLNDLFEQTRSKLGTLSKDQNKYSDTMKNLLLEGFYALNEKKVLVRCRKSDEGVVKKAAENAKNEYKKNMSKDVDVTIDDKERLPDDSAGGVAILTANCKIDINNSFEERLHLLETEALPSVREILFGKNENRRFTD